MRDRRKEGGDCVRMGGEGVEKRIIVVECFVNYTEECLV